MPGHDLIHNGDGRYCSKCGCCWDNDEPIPAQCSLTPADAVADQDATMPERRKTYYPEYLAGPDDLLAWAEQVMQRPPDAIIGDDQLRRWWLVPRNPGVNVYLHEFVKSDDARALHDHPSDNMSMLIAGEYIEHLPDGPMLRTTGDIIERKSTDAHRIEIPPGGRAISLFLTGPKIRQWGFLCPERWVPAHEFVSPTDGGQIGRGCD